jgi:MFS family permease
VVKIKSESFFSKSFLGLSSFQMLAMFRRGLFYTYLSIYFRSFLHLSVTETTLYATLPMIMSVIFQNFVWGPLSDKLQKRRTLIILGEVLAGIGTILVWFIHYGISNLLIAGYVIIIGLSIIEIFWSMSNIAWSALISDMYPSEERSKIMGRLTSLGGMGRIFGISIGGILYDYGFGFRDGPLFFFASMVMFISTFPMLLTPEGGIHHQDQVEIIEKTAEINNHGNGSYKKVFIIFIISLLFINFGRNSISVPYSQFLVLPTGFAVDSIMLSWIANTRSISVLLIGFSAGFLSKKLGHSRTLILGSLIAILSLVFTAVATDLSMIFVGSFLMGTGEVIIYASSYAIASNLIPEKVRAKLFGAYNTTFFLSWGLACTLISGPMIDALLKSGVLETLAYQASFILGALITLMGLIIFILLEIIMRIKEKS